MPTGILILLAALVGADPRPAVTRHHAGTHAPTVRATAFPSARMRPMPILDAAARHDHRHGPVPAPGHGPLPGTRLRTRRAAPRPRRKGPRSRDEVERERHLLRADTELQIDRIVAEFHAALPRDRTRARGAIYARYSSRFQHSILDQVRTLLDAALKQGVFVPREFVFYDLAISGSKERRPGLDRLRKVLTDKAIDVFLVFTTNRLFRKTYKALQFVEEQVVGRGIRCLFVKSGVDSADEKRWRMLLQIHAMTDEFVVGMYADNIRAAHEGLFDNGLVCTTLSFGYRGRPIPGQMTKRNRPRCLVELDPEAAPWVERAFSWYVVERLSLDEIARRFNDDPTIPLGPKCISGQWSHLSIRYLVANPRYRGDWAYGKTRSLWVAQKDYARQVPRAQPLKQAQLEHLRIVADDLWFRAQQRLAEEARPTGRTPGGERRALPPLLNGVFVCPEHGRALYPGGAHGRMMFCPACKALPRDRRPLYSLLNRALALRLTCARLAECLRRDEALVAAVIAACRDEVAAAQQPDPARLLAARSRREALTRQVQFLLDNLGETHEDRREAEERLRQLRRDRAAADAEIGLLTAARTRAIALPAEEEVRDLIDRLGAILAAAGRGDAGEEGEVGRAREVVRLLTGGRIELVQQGERKAQRGWLQGRFRLRLLSGLIEGLTGVAPQELPAEPEVAIDYREPSPSEGLADEVKARFDRGMLIKAIAAELGISRNLASLALNRWYEERGLEKPDGRARRATLECKHLETPQYLQIADEVMRLYDEGVLLGTIANRIGCDRNTVTKSISHWHRSRGLPVPDGRTRRKGLDQPSSRPRRTVDDRGTTPAA